ncbi:uncharacterized protein LOC118924999 [Manis pentadactyla]|uniref:uncharacterized protein LOC118924999 n=1 Tax=Manis pentadactyla TaxID=143292 RepID=UPI00255CF79C|nr:uncharacterized protein LOC118924999 [Manis pentadactyla]
MGPRCPPLPGRLGPPGPVCSWLHLVPPVLSSHLSRILDKSGDHRSRQDTPGENKPQCLVPTETPHPERPTLQKEPESQWARSSAVERPQEVCSVPTSTCRGLSKGWKPRVNTCHGTPSLELNTREMLEARTRRLRAQHRRRVLLKVVQALAVYRLKKTHAWPILQSALAAPGACVSGIPGRLKFPDLVGKAPQAFPGETLETEEAASSTGRPLLARSRQPYHNTEAESELKSKVKVQSLNHPRHCPPHMPFIRGEAYPNTEAESELKPKVKATSDTARGTVLFAEVSSLGNRKVL